MIELYQFEILILGISAVVVRYFQNILTFFCMLKIFQKVIYVFIVLHKEQNYRQCLVKKNLSN